VWWYISVIPVPRSQRQEEEDGEFKFIPVFQILRGYLKKKKKKKWKAVF
jgi:hypothetical protein